MSSISTMVAAEAEERTAKEVGAAYSDAGRIRFQEIYSQRLFDVSNASICTVTRSRKAHGEVVWLAAAAWKLSQALRQRLPANLITSYVKTFGFPAADAVKWLRGAEAPSEHATLRLCVTDDFGYQERRSCAGPQVSQRGHAEFVGYTWYFIQAELTPIPQARLDVQDEEMNWDLDTGKRSVFVLAPRRLTHLQGLHHHVKKVLGPAEYSKHFSDTPFARSGGVPGTTARLNTWLKKLGDVINSYATEDTVSPSLVFAVLVFLRGLEPGVRSVSPSVALRGFSFQQEKENQPEELATDEGLVAALKAEAAVPEPESASSSPQKSASTGLIHKLQGTWVCLRDKRRMGEIHGRQHYWDEPFIATLRSSPLTEISANIVQIEIQGIHYNGRVKLGKTNHIIEWSDGDVWIKLRERQEEKQKVKKQLEAGEQKLEARERKLEESQGEQQLDEERKESQGEQQLDEERKDEQRIEEKPQDGNADVEEWKEEQPPQNKEQKEDKNSDDEVLENEYL
eukprot:TRINITY_DN19154_c0_g1_i2.p1 TRINITY_DN19154_c0_g1~~TRINITY_DN19154_c0_g1_i2.p1  ORF type:complete len:511 (-),score=98.96 TRINITY_DN19154_c0_g1_i2:211-1743(-)